MLVCLLMLLFLHQCGSVNATVQERLDYLVHGKKLAAITLPQ